MQVKSIITPLPFPGAPRNRVCALNRAAYKQGRGHYPRCVSLRCTFIRSHMQGGNLGIFPPKCHIIYLSWSEARQMEARHRLACMYGKHTHTRCLGCSAEPGCGGVVSAGGCWLSGSSLNLPWPLAWMSCPPGTGLRLQTCVGFGICRLS